jgi:hypothetical protein
MTDAQRIEKLERDATITRWAGIAAIIGAPLTACGLLIGLVGIKEVHDWLFISVFHHYATEQQHAAVSPMPVIAVPQKTLPSPAASDKPSTPAPVEPPKPVYTDHDPATGAVYERTISFDKKQYANPNKIRGGDSKTPGREVLIDWQAPGPVTFVSGKCLVGWCEIESCNYHDDIAHCEGWTNDGNPGTINMTVKWVQPVTTHQSSSGN